MMRLPSFLQYVLLMVLTGGCAQMTPFYGNASNPHNSTPAAKPGEDYRLAYVEFGEQGSYQDPTQLENALQLIKETPRPLVVTYVHGWQNNAKSGDAAKFSKFLQEVSQSAVVRASHFHVVGIYLGWRGKLTAVPLAKELTFFSRKAAAERLASNFDCYDAIGAVSEAARKYHKTEGQYTILLGHSFGGLVVERSVAHAINAEMHGHADSEKSLPADLILLLNPASDSILARQMIEALYSRHLEDTRQFVVSLTSTADGATGTAFPAGTNLGAVTKVFNQVRVPGPEPRTESERAFFTTTPGHNKALINHETEDLHKTLPGNGQSAFEVNLSHNLGGHVFATDDDAGGLKLWHFRQVGVVDVPYWDVAVDPSIIKNHGDIWNPKARAMMAAIFRMNFPKKLVAAAPARLTRAPVVTAAPAAASEKPNLQQPPDFSRLKNRQ
ncbi:MAG: hypothetical protein QOD99_1102 [Chthoniobacter sp.]|nr:hypothetical protein [Chthoniobacter sp.]